MTVRTYLRKAFLETRSPGLDLFMAGWSIAAGLLTDAGAWISLLSLAFGAWWTVLGVRGMRRLKEQSRGETA